MFRLNTGGGSVFLPPIFVFFVFSVQYWAVFARKAQSRTKVCGSVQGMLSERATASCVMWP